MITDEDICRSGATDLPTVLRRIPGLEVMQVTGADFNLSMRGDNQLASNKLLVMIDGRSIYVDVQGSVFWKAIPVTLLEIKRIEVQKGPASVLYGFNAFDGIVNIIMKSPEEMKGATAQFGGGAYGTISSSAVYANTYKRLGFRLSYGHDQNQQWRNGSTLAYRDNKFNVQTEYALGGESKLSFSGGLVDANRFDGFVSDAVVQTGVPDLGYAQAGYERTNFFIRGFWNSYDLEGLIITNPLLAPFLRFTDPSFSFEQRLRGNTYNLSKPSKESRWGPPRSSPPGSITGITPCRITLLTDFVVRIGWDSTCKGSGNPPTCSKWSAAWVTTSTPSSIRPSAPRRDPVYPFPRPHIPSQGGLRVSSSHVF